MGQSCRADMVPHSTVAADITRSKAELRGFWRCMSLCKVHSERRKTGSPPDQSHFVTIHRSNAGLVMPLERSRE